MMEKRQIKQMETDNKFPSPACRVDDHSTCRMLRETAERHSIRDPDLSLAGMGPGERIGWYTDCNCLCHAGERKFVVFQNRPVRISRLDRRIDIAWPIDGKTHLLFHETRLVFSPRAPLDLEVREMVLVRGSRTFIFDRFIAITRGPDSLVFSTSLPVSLLPDDRIEMHDISMQNMQIPAIILPVLLCLRDPGPPTTTIPLDPA